MIDAPAPREDLGRRDTSPAARSRQHFDHDGSNTAGSCFEREHASCGGWRICCGWVHTCRRGSGGPGALCPLGADVALLEFNPLEDIQSIQRICERIEGLDALPAQMQEGGRLRVLDDRSDCRFDEEFEEASTL